MQERQTHLRRGTIERGDREKIVEEREERDKGRERGEGVVVAHQSTTTDVPLPHENDVRT